MMEIIGILFAAVVGSGLTYVFGIRTKQKESALRHKEEQYSKLIVKLQGFLGQTANAQTKREFFEEQYKSWLYSSDEVIEAINKMINVLIEHYGKTPDPAQGRELIGNIIIAIRKDLHGKTKLGNKDFRYTDVL